MKILKSCFAITTAISILALCNAEKGFYQRKSLYGGTTTTGKFLYSGYDTRTASMIKTEEQKIPTKHAKSLYTKSFDNLGYDNHQNQYVKNIASKFANCNYTEKIMATDKWD